MHISSTNFAKTLVWKREYDVKLWRHKSAHQIQMNTICHRMKHTPPMKMFCVRHWRQIPFPRTSCLYWQVAIVDLPRAFWFTEMLHDQSRTASPVSRKLRFEPQCRTTATIFTVKLKIYCVGEMKLAEWLFLSFLSKYCNVVVMAMQIVPGFWLTLQV